jgi:hypothetical protein
MASRAENKPPRGTWAKFSVRVVPKYGPRLNTNNMAGKLDESPLQSLAVYLSRRHIQQYRVVIPFPLAKLPVGTEICCFWMLRTSL